MSWVRIPSLTPRELAGHRVGWGSWLRGIRFWEQVGSRSLPTATPAVRSQACDHQSWPTHGGSRRLNRPSARPGARPGMVVQKRESGGSVRGIELGADHLPSGASLGGDGAGWVCCWRRATHSAAQTMGMLRKEPSSRMALSPVTIRSACPAAASSTRLSGSSASSETRSADSMVSAAAAAAAMTAAGSVKTAASLGRPAHGPARLTARGWRRRAPGPAPGHPNEDQITQRPAYSRAVTERDQPRNRRYRHHAEPRIGVVYHPDCRTGRWAQISWICVSLAGQRSCVWKPGFAAALPLRLATLAGWLARPLPGRVWLGQCL